MKKLYVLMAMFGLLCGIVSVFNGCGQKKNTIVVTATPTPFEKEAATLTPTPSPTLTPTPFPIGEVDRTAAFELLSKMNVGWNLGNTFDATGSGLNAEISWGNPKTTQEMIDAIANKGFNTIRIPITFAKHLKVSDNYKIDEAWLARIKEVVDYAYKNGMYILIDTHHEPDSWLKPGVEYRDSVKEELSAIWTQVAEYFKDYDEHLIFEGMNEPRTKGSQYEWSGGTQDERESINIFNETFVEAVRKTGGNNATRLLILAPYGNSVTASSLRDMRIPEDANVAVAVHMYTPYYFTYNPNSGGYFEWTSSRKSEVNSVFNTVKRDLIDKGVPAIITEFGAVHKTKKDAQGNTVDNTEEVLKWLEDYLGIANRYGIKCIWWDNGVYSVSNSEPFGIFNRRQCKFYNDDIANKLVELGNKGIIK